MTSVLVSQFHVYLLWVNAFSAIVQLRRSIVCITNIYYFVQLHGGPRCGALRGGRHHELARDGDGAVGTHPPGVRLLHPRERPLHVGDDTDNSWMPELTGDVCVQVQWVHGDQEEPEELCRQHAGEGQVGCVVGDSTEQYSTVQYSLVQYSTVQYSTVQYSTV